MIRHMLVTSGDKNLTRTACLSHVGNEAKEKGAWDARDVDCRNCMRTNKYKIYMGKK